MRAFFLLVFSCLAMTAHSQVNCAFFETPAAKKACFFYNEAIKWPQGAHQSQALFDSSLAADPTFAMSYREKSAPYLKRGDFYHWKLLIDKAVEYNPGEYLGIRGWCLFKFLHDYEGALADLNRLDTIVQGNFGTSGDGEYNLLIIKALCERETGDMARAMADFDSCIIRGEQKGYTGLYDYLHRGVTKLKNQDYRGAIRDLEKQTVRYPELADTYYYLGLSHQALTHKNTARTLFLHAQALYTGQGFHRGDPYCGLPDQVYLRDIEQMLTE